MQHYAPEKSQDRNSSQKTGNTTVNRDCGGLLLLSNLCLYCLYTAFIYQPRLPSFPDETILLVSIQPIPIFNKKTKTKKYTKH